MEREAWDDEADVVVVGAGAVGLPAAIAAREAGASVLVLEANWDIGGHAAISGGNVPLGGGTSEQKKHGIVDSPDLLFSDLTDWSVVESNGFPDYRYNDREIIRSSVYPLDRRYGNARRAGHGEAQGAGFRATALPGEGNV